MAVNKNKKVTEEVVAQTEAPSTETTNNAKDMTAQFMEMLASMKETISSLKNELDEQKKKNEELYRAAHVYTKKEQEDNGILTKAVVEDIKEELDDI